MPQRTALDWQLTVTAVLSNPTPLAPVSVTLRAAFGTDDLPGLAPGLIVTDETGWRPATELVDGSGLPELLSLAARQWRASPHAAAALAFKAYSYWTLLPAVLGWASARRVPLLRPQHVLIRYDGGQLRVGLSRSVRVAVLPTDPLALTGLPEVMVVPDETALLDELRAALLDGHLTPMAEAIHQRVRVGTRTLLGSVASGVAYAILRAADALPGSSVETVGVLLDTFGVSDLVELVPGPGGVPTVQRRTCCLAFTLPQPRVCNGCCIRPS